MTPEYVTIHNTANDATASNEIAYMTRNPEATSYHVAVDDKKVVQAIPFTRNGWHAGDGQGKGNRTSIGIEICYSKSGGPKYVAAEENTVEYVAHILKQYGWGIDRVKWHRDWSGKKCPHRIFAEGRADEVKRRIAARLAILNGVASTQMEKEDEELKFSSGTLKKEWETFLNSKAQRDITVKAAVKAGYSEKWIKDLEEGKATDGDIVMLGLGALIRANK